MTFTIKGCRIRISLLFAAVLALMLTVDRTGMAALTLSGVLVHELGHILAMLPLRQFPREISLDVGAMHIKKPAAISLGSELFILSAGAMANLLAGGVLMLASRFWPAVSAPLVGLSLAQAAVAAVNLLPVTGLDGGAILSLLLARAFGPRVAQAVMLMLSGLLIAGLATLGTALILSGGRNLSLVCFAVYLATVMVMKMR